MPRRPKRSPPVEIVDARIGLMRRADSLARLRNSGAIDSRQWRAAEKYRHAAETVNASGLSTLAEGVGGGVPASRTLPQQVLEAAETLAEARKRLGRMDELVVLFVVVGGYSIAQTARAMFPCEARPREHVGHRLRTALGELANLWFGKERPRAQHVHLAEGARPEIGLAGELVPGRSAHADRRRVTYG